MRKWLVCIIMLTFMMVGCSKAAEGQVEITVSAAASLMDSLAEVTADFEAAYPDVKVTYNFGGSGALRKQIEQGAPIDLFLSAAEKEYRLLEDGGFIREGALLFSNVLVYIVSTDAELESLDEVILVGGKVAIGTPETVPAGMYAKEALEANGDWADLQGWLVYAQNVSQVLTYVEEKAVDLGAVYLTDAVRSDKVRVVEEIDSSQHSPIDYYVGTIKRRDRMSEAEIAAARTFLEFVQSEQSQAVFSSYGFEIKE